MKANKKNRQVKFLEEVYAEAGVGPHADAKTVAEALVNKLPLDKAKASPLVLMADAVAKDAKVQVESAKEVAAAARRKGEEDKHAEVIAEIGNRIVFHTVQAGTLYMELCQYIRANKVAPKLVSFALSRRGFHRVRISEINRVAMASDKNWNAFQAGLVGFGKVLELERANGELTPVAIAVADAQQLAVDEVEQQVKAIRSDGGEKARVSEDLAAMDEKRFCQAAYALASWAEKHLTSNSSKRSVTVGNGFEVIVRRAARVSASENIRGKIRKLREEDADLIRKADKELAQDDAEEQARHVVTPSNFVPVGE